jgi:hypothetical protein
LLNNCITKGRVRGPRFLLSIWLLLVGVAAAVILVAAVALGDFAPAQG